MGTPFTAVYKYFLNSITDDLYLELTPKDTIRDLQNLLINSIPGFEFPRINLYDYTILIEEINKDNVQLEDFVINEDDTGIVVIDRSSFNVVLTQEEIAILALLMKQAWVQRQVTSIENTRMKYSGSDFKMTSQANHLSKLLALLKESERASFHMQRLYKRRKLTTEGKYISTWSIFGQGGKIDEI